jgi:hypothetical protein
VRRRGQSPCKNYKIQAPAHVEFVPPLVYFDVYMVAFQPPADLWAYEFGLEWSIPQDVELRPGATQLPPGFFPFCDPDPPCTVAGSGTSSCLAAAPVLVLETWHVLAMTPIHDVRFRATAAPVSSFQPPAPGMLVCGGQSEEDLVPFAFAHDGWAVMNGPVGADASTWGTLKALFAP